MPDDMATIFTAGQDQMAAIMRPVADNVASYFKQMRKGGLSRSEALELANAYQERLFEMLGIGSKEDA